MVESAGAVSRCNARLTSFALVVFGSGDLHARRGLWTMLLRLSTLGGQEDGGRLVVSPRVQRVAPSEV